MSNHRHALTRYTVDTVNDHDVPEIGFAKTYSGFVDKDHNKDLWQIFYANPDHMVELLNESEDTRKHICEHFLLGFIMYYKQQMITSPFATFHYEMMQDFEKLPIYRDVYWQAFRGSAKSAIARAGIEWLIAYKKRKMILIDSVSKDVSGKAALDITFTLQSNDLLIDDFGDLFSAAKQSFNKRKQKKKDDYFMTNNDIVVQALSVYESPRGAMIEGARPDFLLLDDFDNEKTARSVAMTAVGMDHMRTIRNGMSPDGVRLYLGNKVGNFGVASTFFERTKRKRDIPIMVNERPTWPERFPRYTKDITDPDNQESIQQKMESNSTYEFMAEFMNIIEEDGVNRFKTEWIQEVPRETDFMNIKRVLITLDPSTGLAKDNTGVVINYVLQDGTWLVESYAKRLDSAQLIDYLFELKRNYNPDVLAMEDFLFTKAVQPFLRVEETRRNEHLYVKKLKPHRRGKEARIAGLMKFVETGRIKFIQNQNSYLLEEMIRFPMGDTDDVLDALAYQLDIDKGLHVSRKVRDNIQKTIKKVTYKPRYPSIGI